MWSILKEPKIDSNLQSKLAVIKHYSNEITLAYTDEELTQYNQDFLIKHIHSSLTTEGVEISKSELQALIQGTEPSTLSHDAYLECNNLCEAARHLQAFKIANFPLTEPLLLKLHSMLGINLLPSQSSGHYRQVRNMIGRGNYETAQINQIPKLMSQLFAIANSIENPVVRAAWFSYNLVAIHPFVDFNGRLSRLCESYILSFNNLPTVYLTQCKVSEYMRLIREGTESGDPVNLPYINFICDLVVERLEDMRNNDTKSDSTDHSIKGFGDWR